MDDYRNLSDAWDYSSSQSLLSATATTADGWRIVRNYTQFIDALKHLGMPMRVSFDHDLHKEHIDDYYKSVRYGNAPDYNNYTVPSGRACAIALVNFIKQNPAFPPPSINIHSANRRGRAEIKNILQEYL